MAIWGPMVRTAVHTFSLWVTARPPSRSRPRAYTPPMKPVNCRHSYRSGPRAWRLWDGPYRPQVRRLVNAVAPRRMIGSWIEPGWARFKDRQGTAMSRRVTPKTPAGTLVVQATAADELKARSCRSCCQCDRANQLFRRDPRPGAGCDAGAPHFLDR
jgi:hypothetical protein